MEKVSLILIIVCILIYFSFKRIFGRNRNKITNTNNYDTPNKIKEEDSVYAKEFGKAEFLEIKSTKFPSKYLKPIKDLPDNGSFFYKKKVVITGGLESFPFREKLAKQLWELGADIDTVIGKYTDIAIVGSYNVGPKKMEKILSQNIKIIREKELEELLKPNT